MKQGSDEDVVVDVGRRRRSFVRTLSSAAEQIKMVIAPNDLSPPDQIGPSRKPAPSADTAREPGVPPSPTSPTCVRVLSGSNRAIPVVGGAAVPEL